MARPYDIVVHGATGFTGKQCAAYLGEHAPASLRWAVSGRDLKRVEAVKAELAGAKNPPAGALQADGTDAAACGAMAREARVVLTTAGPFARFGSGVVEGCVREGTDYVDITGETPWVRDMIDRHHDAAVARGIRIVPCCGFDSIPSDLGTLLVVERLRAHGEATARVTGWFSGRGGLNGGTLASALNLGDPEAARRIADPILLNPPSARTDELRRRSPDRKGPTFDEVRGSWGAPFVMAVVNTRIVRRSDALLAEVGRGHGPRFVYEEFTDLGPRAGRVMATVAAGAMAAADKALRTRVGRAVAAKLGPAPGEGPSERTMDEGWFRTELVGTGERGRVVHGTVASKGDPGNRSTVRMLCESALALVLDRPKLDALPHRGGVLTPATAFGTVLVDRLRAAGMTLDARD